MSNVATLIIHVFGDNFDHTDALDYLADKFPCLAALSLWTNDEKAGGDKIIGHCSFAMCSTKLLNSDFDKEAVFIEIANAPWCSTSVPLVAIWESDNEENSIVLVYDINTDRRWAKGRPKGLVSRTEV